MLFTYAYDNAARVVLMTKHREAELDTWMGTNNGHWEGDTLVIDVTGFNGRAWLDRAGNFASDSLHVVERYTMLDANTINYEATLEDPDTLHQAVEDQFPAVPSSGKECAPAAFPVRGVRRRNDVWRSHQEA